MVEVGSFGDKSKSDISHFVPLHEVDQGLNIGWEILGINGHCVARVVGKLFRHIEAQLPDILPVTFWSESLVRDKLHLNCTGNSQHLTLWQVLIDWSRLARSFFLQLSTARCFREVSGCLGHHSRRLQGR